MKLSHISLFAFKPVYDNDVDALNPEIWAQESLQLLLENMVAANLVYRDFSPEIAAYGDVVNTRKPASFTVKRKGNSDEVTVQDVTITNVPVKLDQHLHTSFMIKDGEESKSFKDLVDFQLRPAIQSIAQGLDKIVLGQTPAFLDNATGHLNGLSSSNVLAYMTGLRKVQNDNKVPINDRNLIVTSAAEATMLSNELFISAEKVGDQGTALRDASLGKKLGYATFMCQNQPFVDINGCSTVTGAINNASGYAAGTTSITVDGLSAAIAAGTYFTVAGDDIPHTVTSTTGGSTPTAIVFTPALATAVVNDAVVTIYKPLAVDLTAGYDAGYVKEIHVDALTSAALAPQVGQAIAFGTTTSRRVYTIVEVSNVTATDADILLDRPLDLGLTNDDAAFLAPAGSYNLAFVSAAIGLVIRPLALPKAGAGALAAVVNYNNLSIRVVITYDGNKQGHLVTVDMLAGVKVLDSELGAVLLT